MRKSAAAVAVLLVSALIVPSQGIAAQQQDRRRRFVVVYADGASLASARAAVKAANATIVSENAKIGVATVETRNSNFVQAVENQSALVGAARNRPIGRAEPRLWVKPDIERLDLGAGVEAASSADRKGPEPLAHLQWDMRMIHATKKGSYREQRGDPGVMVGIIDTGIEGSHPDIEPNFDEEMSRNFTVDIPLVDGPCADDPDGSCKDPADVDENGHGTHVAGTVAAPINGRGIAGVAPDVTLVNLRGGQDSGYFFLQPSVDALTYAGDAGVDVVNMSYFIDPWLFNCRGNPADSPAQQREQRTIITATQRALDYAHRRGVTLVSALGNKAIDLGRPEVDTISPDFPPGEEKERQISNSCLTLPTEGRHVIGVSALGPSERKSWYSNWGLEQTDVSAPGGDSVDILPEPRGRILAPYPRVALEAEGLLDPDGRPNTPAVLRECRNDRCNYYRYLQGTSMASPHAVGVAALIVSEFGESESDEGLTLDPDRVAARLESTATDHRCPPGRVQEYPELAELEGIVGPWEAYTAHCAGSRERNGFYGHGIVDALSAVADD